ncbi:choice-of-anchor Q domain-containing protein, partial [Streptomyces sp. NPDC126514]|uniref:choice-of-anchor Q domain-containing protein n=1 Tax=Streptomyces sp. NPDC126514 TaxID=3155210 RepID=UPI003316AE9D
HNTAYRNGRSTRMESYANIFAHDSKDVRLLNKVSYGRPGQATNSKSRNVDVIYDYNIYYGGKAPEVKGPHDLIADPEIVEPGGGRKAAFRLREGSPAIGSAKSLPAVTTDITGSRRDAGAPDRGAYAFATDDTAPGTDPTAASGSGEGASESDGSAQGSGAQDAEESSSSSSDETGSGTANDVQADGDSQPLATTGASVALPLGLAVAALAFGAGIIFLLRRKRS